VEPRTSLDILLLLAQPADHEVLLLTEVSQFSLYEYIEDIPL
jgi:hypothetical protein